MTTINTTPLDRYEARVREAVAALTEVIEDPECSYEPQRTALLAALDWLEMEVTCGDCIEGRCHWGGERSRQSIAAVKAGREYVDPDDGTCGCARHEASAEARQRRRRLRRSTRAAAGDITVTEITDQEVPQS